mmetsp:Transcript_15493/g.22910  ORF Transcript_15493/g.22910 Transcript_15493/m.22910 type:complete len:104 (-) Transcript_15493:58-369(-)
MLSGLTDRCLTMIASFPLFFLTFFLLSEANPPKIDELCSLESFDGNATLLFVGVNCELVAVQVLDTSTNNRRRIKAETKYPCFKLIDLRWDIFTGQTNDTQGG